jgi:glycosyltransferase involved in cell wall biosynthesis
MKVLQVNAYDIEGGAARAAYRIHRSLVEHGATTGLDCKMRVIGKLTDDPTVLGGLPATDGRLSRRLWRRIRPRLTGLPHRGFRSGNPTMHSTAWPATGLGAELRARHQRGELDLVNLHWLGDDTLSIEEIAQLPFPVVWTLHDQWAFCGAEHYTDLPDASAPEALPERFARGYDPESRPAHESGPDVNRRTWLRKRRHWRRPIELVCPSTWMADCARRSTLARDWPITVIPNPVDLRIWAPVDQRVARSLLRLPPEVPLILFGALRGTADPRKGAGLLLEALHLLRGQVSGTRLERLELVIFGQSRPATPPALGFPIHFSGRLHDDVSLRLLYAAADLFVIPSLQDNLPNTGVEAHACGTPVVAFRTGGLGDIVEDGVTGELADPFVPASLAAAMRRVLEDPRRASPMRAAARARAERWWAPERVAALYAEVYARAQAKAKG